MMTTIRMTSTLGVSCTQQLQSRQNELAFCTLSIPRHLHYAFAVLMSQNSWGGQGWADFCSSFQASSLRALEWCHLPLFPHVVNEEPQLYLG